MANTRRGIAAPALRKGAADQPSATSCRRGGWLLPVTDVLAVFVGLMVGAYSHDLIGSSSAFMGSGALPPATAPTLGTSFLAFFLFPAAAVVLVFWIVGHYERGRASLTRFVQAAPLTALLGAGHLIVLTIAFPNVAIAPVVAGWALVTVFVFAGRQMVLPRLIRAGAWYQPTVIIGHDEQARRLARHVENDIGLGLRVTHIVRPVDGARDDSDPFDSRSVVAEVMTRFQDHLVLLCPGSFRKRRQAPVGPAKRALRTVIGILDRTFRRRPRLPGDATVYRARNQIHDPIARVAKRSVDVVVSLLMMILLTPLFILLSLSSLRARQPVFFGHRRVGQNGRSFTCYKFRSMVPEAEAMLERILAADPETRREWAESFKLKNDPRVTQFGNLLRRTSLDELPQLWNVLKGDMSLVGPRPIVDPELSFYGANADTYMAVRPGMTGLWQVSGRTDTDYPTRVALDARYVLRWSFWLDIAILFRTAAVVLKRNGAY